MLAFCRRCGHVFNLAFDPALTGYTSNYENSLHFSPRFQRYAVQLAGRLVQRYRLHDRTILEIGSGRGDFLKLLCEMGPNRGVGFDPSCPDDLAGDGDCAGRLTFVRDYFTERYSSYRADMICSRQTLEHIGNPSSFLRMLRAAVDKTPDTVVFFEVPNMLFTLRRTAIWDIIYEHCSYFTQTSLTCAFSAAGFAVRQVGTGFGGQYLLLEARGLHSVNCPPPPDGAAIALLTEGVGSFAARYRRKVETWRRRLEKLARDGGRIVVWGAGSKGVTFLNTIGIPVEYAVDVNPRKHNLYVAGTGQQIVPPEFLRGYQPDLIVVMNRIYLSEIQESATRLELRGRLICA